MASLWLADAENPETDTFVPDVAYDDVILGAGLTGLVTAVLLARAGRRVAVLEARRVGSVTTGHTTGKLTLLQGTRLSSIMSAHSKHVTAAYLEGNRAGMDWVLRYCGERGVPVDRRVAWTYAGTKRGTKAVDNEYDAARQVGLAVRRQEPSELPYATYGAISLPDQAQLYPQALLAALASEFRGAGGVLVENCRALGVGRSQRGTRVQTPAGSVIGQDVILASGVPFLDRGLYFAKLSPERSYVQAFRVPGPVPAGMYLSTDQPTRTLRTARHRDEELLVVGGNGHGVGRHGGPTSQLVADLSNWTEERFPGAVATHTWSAQDYRSPNFVPFAGPLPRGQGRIFVATGYGKWGMSNAPMAALMIVSQILGEKKTSWAETLGTRVSKPAAALQLLGHNASVGVQALRGWAAAELTPLAKDADVDLAEGEGMVGARSGQPIGLAKVDGEVCSVSAVCTHLGGVVRWNDLERSWDCPLHGSRFAADGTVLEGPATKPLRTAPG